MNRTITYPPQTPRYDNGGYRYFFNGQETDNEVFGEGIRWRESSRGTARMRLRKTELSMEGSWKDWNGSRINR